MRRQNELPAVLRLMFCGVFASGRDRSRDEAGRLQPPAERGCGDDESTHMAYFAPPDRERYDGNTALVGATMMFEILCVVAEARVARL